MKRTTKKTAKKSKTVLLGSNKIEKSPLSIEQKKYHSKMTILWVASAISGCLLGILLIIYAKEIKDILLENLVVSSVYILIFISWKIYRIKSKLKIMNHPDFYENFKYDLHFSRKFNNTEIIKTLISYFILSVPIFYATGFAKQIFSYFGFYYNGFSSDLQTAVFSIILAIGNLVLSIIGSYIYDKIKHKLL